jgi:glyoxylase-like metal-dependent hydrolase (beta-lactamase superfamily II)
MKALNFLQEVAGSIHYIDPLKLGEHSVSGVYLIIADGITLIEVGTSTNVPHILEAVRALGYDANDIKRAIVTHVHLDHSGGAGTLAQLLPRLRIHVHGRGLRHLADPTKLLESAQLVYGTPETISAIHGEVLPVSPKNLVAASDETLDLGGGILLKIFDAPGHAPHHLCGFEPQSGCLFSGEALGHYHPDFNMLLPAVAPPGFDLQASIETIHKIAALKSRIICFSQFGQHRDPPFVLEESERLLKSYAELIREALRDGMDTGDIIEAMLQRISKEPHARKFSEQSIRGMLTSIVLGYFGYFQRTSKANPA